MKKRNLIIGTILFSVIIFGIINFIISLFEPEAILIVKIICELPIIFFSFICGYFITYWLYDY